MAHSFASRLLRWFGRHGRHDLPWQHPRSAYRVWLAEIMLQQTQVATVIPYYRRFLKRFPSLRSLAAAEPDDVLALWSGLGYYARARNLHQAARIVMAEHGGRFPSEFDAVAALPGIGRSTAGAILAQALGQRHPILDGNARRVFARHAAIQGWPGEPRVARKFWRVAVERLPQARLADYTQALMDLGATVCTARKPACGACPVSRDCVARLHNRIHELPTAKPRRKRPQRQAHLLLIENSEGAILLERRPPAGIWGGLWCPPMLEKDWRNECLTRYGLRIKKSRRLPVIQHGFSHYDLDLQPLRVRAQAECRVAEAPGLAWVTLPRTLNYGLPEPVR
ncbi:MAG: A/G-specific adenine glycosylase, partial [Hydrocarboniphaga effusa]|nr:A/G-specific adenine glycosylase [Hydrocarboniphaga effusa]